MEGTRIAKNKLDHQCSLAFLGKLSKRQKYGEEEVVQVGQVAIFQFPLTKLFLPQC